VKKKEYKRKVDDNNKDSSLRGGCKPSLRSITVKNFDTFY